MVQLADLGPDGDGVWCEGAVGLGHRLFHNTPESLHETLPLESADGRLVMTASARLDNRYDLLRALGVPPAERADTPDSTLILNAYEKWGEDCPAHLLGDWSFAVWDARKRTLFLARDHCGETELVFHHSGKLFAFASSIGALLALPGVPRKPNQLEVARLLACLGRYSENTCYEGVQFLCVAQALTVTPQRRHQRRYWQPEKRPDLRLKSDRAYVDAFLDVYAEAVRCRLRSVGPVCATLSGGLDSSSTASLAARELAKDGKRLPVFTWAPTYDTGAGVDPKAIVDELPYARATAGQVGNIDVHPVRTDSITPIASFQRTLDQTAESRFNTNASNVFETLDRASAQRMTTLLTGQGGNMTVSTDGRTPYLTQLARRGQWRSLWRETTSWRSLHGSTLRQALKSQFVLPLIPAPVLSRYVGFRHGTQRAQASVLHPTFEHEIRGFLNDLRHERNDLSVMHTRHGWWDSVFWRRGRRWPSCGRHGRLEVRDPTLDARLVEFCLSVPLEQWARDAQDRWLIRQAMAGLLPDRVAWNRTRGRQAADFAWHLHADLAAAENLCDELDRSQYARQFMDLGKLRTALGELREDGPAGVPDTCMKSLHRGLSMGMYLLGFDR